MTVTCSLSNCVVWRHLAVSTLSYNIWFGIFIYTLKTLPDLDSIRTLFLKLWTKIINCSLGHLNSKTWPVESWSSFLSYQVDRWNITISWNIAGLALGLLVSIKENPNKFKQFLNCHIYILLFYSNPGWESGWSFYWNVVGEKKI